MVVAHKFHLSRFTLRVKLNLQNRVNLKCCKKNIKIILLQSVKKSVSKSEKTISMLIFLA